MPPPHNPRPSFQPGDQIPSSCNQHSHTNIFPDILWTAVAISTSFAVLYGLFLTLAVVSAYLLLRRGVRRPLSAIQLFAVTTLLASTTVHWAIVVLQRFGGLLSHPGTVTFGDNKVAFLPQQCVGTATLTVNIILGDLVVWWRVWVLWQDSRVLYRRIVHICGCALLVATFSESPSLFSPTTFAVMPSMSLVYAATGVVDTHFACSGKGGFMYEGLPVGTTASALSLAIHLAATTLTAYKAWVHRKCIRSHVASGSRSTQVESIFALLVESGALYCTLWIVVMVWQIGARISDPHMRSSIFLSLHFSDKHQPNADSFWFRGGVLVEGCLVPLIAIYPTAIIVLVALNKSTVENSLKRDTACDPPAAITVAVETVVDMHSHDNDIVCSSSDIAEDGSDFSHTEKRPLQG